MTDNSAEEGTRQCAHSRTGPKIGRNVVAWRQQCRRKVRAPADYCWQHESEHFRPLRNGPLARGGER